MPKNPTAQKNRNLSGITRFALCASFSAVLAACHGGGGGDQSLSSASSMSGTAAVGLPLARAPIVVRDTNGKTVSTTSDANGNYSVPLQGLTAPLLITAVDKSGVSGTLYSVVATTSTANGGPVTANVTPLTTAVSALITTSGNPLDLAQSGGLSVVNGTSVSAAIAKLDSVLGPILSANQLSSSSFNPISGTFTANQTGADAVIDSVAVTPSSSGSGYQISSLADPDTAIQLNASSSISTTLSAPPQPLNYLATLTTTLSQCASDMQAAGDSAGTSASSDASCSASVDSSYLNNGNANFGTRHTLYTKGTVLTGIKTVAFVSSGTLPGINHPGALVYLLMTDPDGTPDFGMDYVQQQSNGKWNIIGNQQLDSTYIASFVGRTQYTDPADAANGHYESGLDIQIPLSVNVSGTPTDIGSALVTGPGLPTSGLWLQYANNGIAAGQLEIPTGTLSAPISSSNVRVDGGMSTTYKWSWAPLSGSTTSFAPSGLPEYAAASQDVSTIQNFGVYTVKMYDLTGTLIRTDQIQNIARNYSAATGGLVAWQTLGSDVIANYLTPGGSGSQSSPGTSAQLDWSMPSGAVFPNFWASINSLGAPLSGVPATTYDATVWGPSTGTAPTSLTFNTDFVDVLQAMSSAPAELAVQVQLGWQAGGDFYLNTWQYNN